jgi:hypothetical protein
VKDDPYFLQREAIRRAKVVGFNLYRIWNLECSDTAKKGDLSTTDVSDFFVAECARQQVHLWTAGFGGGAIYQDDIPTSAKVVAAPGETEWSEAVSSMCKPEWWSNGKKAMSLLTVAVAWDPRLEALAIEQMRQKAQHVNVYTGRRHADDPTIAIWELTNEQWWVSNMFNGRWQDMPAYFRKSLIAKWNTFLGKKYGDQAGLTKAWGFLFSGEDLAGPPCN